MRLLDWRALVIISPVTLERLVVLWRRTVAYYRQPRRLVLLPFSLTATILALYALVTGNLSVTLMWVIVGLCIFVTIANGVWAFTGHVLAGYRAGAPKAK